MALGPITASSRFDVWRQILAERQPRTVVEIGVWRGAFAAWALESIRSIERYYMVDPWAPLPQWNKPFNQAREVMEAAMAEALDRTSFASDRVEILRGATKDVAGTLPGGSVDFAYIDGDHTLRGITLDLAMIHPVMAETGLIGGDDFTRSADQHGPRYEPSFVFPYAVYFAEAVDRPIHALPRNQYAIDLSEQGFSFIDHVGRYGDASVSGVVAAMHRRGSSTWRTRLKGLLRQSVLRHARRRERDGGVNVSG